MGEISREEIENLCKEMAKLNENMSRVLFILNNDSKTNRHGLVEDVSILNNRVDKLELEKKLIYAKASAYGGIGAFFVGILAWLISFIVTHLFK
jgi:hypothetical protein